VCDRTGRSERVKDTKPEGLEAASPTWMGQVHTDSGTAADEVGKEQAKILSTKLLTADSNAT
jgi:hypothetical protein